MGSILFMETTCVNKYSPAAIRHNLAIESIVCFLWIMFVKVTNSKGKLTGYLSALCYFRYDIVQYRDCSIRVTVLLLIVSPNSLKINLINTLNPFGVLNLCNKINRDTNRIKVSVGIDYKTEATIQL